MFLLLITTGCKMGNSGNKSQDNSTENVSEPLDILTEYSTKITQINALKDLNFNTDKVVIEKHITLNDDLNTYTWIVDYNADYKAEWVITVGSVIETDDKNEVFVRLLFNENQGIFAYKALTSAEHKSPYSLVEE